MRNNRLLRFSTIAPIALITMLSGNAYAGMIIEKAPSPHPQVMPVKGMVVGHSDVRQISSKERRSPVLGDSVERSRFADIISARPVAKLGPAGYGRFVSPHILLKQLSPKGENWTLSCPTNICEGKTLSWASDGSTPWKELFYQIVSKIDKDLNVRFNVDTKNVSISYPDSKEMNWTIFKDKTLKENLVRWAEDAGWQLDWATGSNYDWETGSTFAIHGTYKDAVNRLFKAYAAKGVYLEAIYYKNRIVRIVHHTSSASY